MKFPTRVQWVLAMSLVTGMQPIWAQAAPVRTPVEHTIGTDRFIAGCPITVVRPVAGDLIAAGCSLDILSEVAGDLVVAGGELRLTAPVKQGVYAAGGRVTIDGTVQRNVRAAGGRVILGPNAKVAGNFTAAGGQVDIDGAVGGYLQVGGGRVRINGPVAGDVEVGAGDIEIGPKALIEGKLRFASRHELQQDPAAQVRGGVEKIEGSDAWFASHQWNDGEHHGHHWIWTAGVLIIAAILALALPRLYGDVAQTARASWSKWLLVGFVALVCVPILALISLITVIGIPLALLLMALYLVLLLLGYASAGVALGDIGLRHWSAERAGKAGWRIAAAVLAMLAISLLGRIPFLGGLLTLLAMLTGMGALLLQLRPAVGSAEKPA